MVCNSGLSAQKAEKGFQFGCHGLADQGNNVHCKLQCVIQHKYFIRYSNLSPNMSQALLMKGNAINKEGLRKWYAVSTCMDRKLPAASWGPHKQLINVRCFRVKVSACGERWITYNLAHFPSADSAWPQPPRQHGKCTTALSNKNNTLHVLSWWLSRSWANTKFWGSVHSGGPTSRHKYSTVAKKFHSFVITYTVCTVILWQHQSKVVSNIGWIMGEGLFQTSPKPHTKNGTYFATQKQTHFVSNINGQEITFTNHNGCFLQCGGVFPSRYMPTLHTLVDVTGVAEVLCACRLIPCSFYKGRHPKLAWLVSSRLGSQACGDASEKYCSIYSKSILF